MVWENTSIVTYGLIHVLQKEPFHNTPHEPPQTVRINCEPGHGPQTIYMVGQLQRSQLSVFA